MTAKTLFVHCGGSKTGSSALQNFLELRRSALAELGFAYRSPVGIRFEHQVQSGNGAALANLLMNPQTSVTDLEACLIGLVGDEPNAICSSEFFSDVDADAWSRLHKSTNRFGIALRPIFFVRNAISFLGSLHDQAIKRHGEWRPFDVWCQEGIWQHPRALRALHSSSVRGGVEVLHYDRIADGMIEQFLRVIGIDRNIALRDDDKRRRVNRSLRAREREALRLINESIGGELSHELSDMLLRVWPDCEPEPEHVSESMARMLEDRYQADVDWINQAWFGGQAVVSVLDWTPSPSAVNASPARHGGAADLRNVEAVEESDGGTAISQNFDGALVNWCIGKMQQSLDKGIERLCAQLRSIDWENSLDPAIPKNFDPVAYLLLNPDLLKNRTKPFQHYLEYGQFELGRLWEWQSL